MRPADFICQQLFHFIFFFTSLRVKMAAWNLLEYTHCNSQYFNLFEHFLKKLKTKQFDFKFPDPVSLPTQRVFTRIANFLPWIQSKLANQCMCKPKNYVKNDTLSVETSKKPTDLSLLSTANRTCNCGNY